VGEGDPRGQHQAGVISTRRYFILPIRERRSLDDRLGTKLSLWRSGDHFRAGSIRDHLRAYSHVVKGPTTEVALIRPSRPNGRASFCDGHSGSPACRNPSSYREMPSACQGPSTSLRLETRSAGLSCRSRATALCACSGRPAIALLAAATRNPG